QILLDFLNIATARDGATKNNIKLFHIQNTFQQQICNLSTPAVQRLLDSISTLWGPNFSSILKPDGETSAAMALISFG
ncbi:MAG: hypothetical protein R3274_09770, partial [Desulfobacterales bacterium]|nr:hypothetical protein [Desulfobacterales bacterium]